MSRFIVSLWFFMSLGIGCGASTQENATPLVVSGAVARLAPGMGAIYLTIQNNTAQEDRLLSVETPGAMIELHESVLQGEVMQMLPRPEGFVVPARGSVALKEGGKHLMVMGVDPSAVAGELPLTLVFQQGGRVSAKASITSLHGGK
jgi:copper(I)-binding protein